MIQETEQLQSASRSRAPAMLRARTLRLVGWTLLLLSLAVLAFHILWMWRRLGSVAPIVAAALSLDAFVGIGLIIAGNKKRD